MDGWARRGCFLHAMHSVTYSGVSLGTAGAETWTRGDHPPSVKTKAERDKQRKQTRIEDKELQRWVDGMHLAHRIASRHRFLTRR